jgi:hypothetical protein
MCVSYKTGCAHTHTHTHTYIHTHIEGVKPPPRCPAIVRGICIYVGIHIHTYIYIYTHIHTQLPLRPSWLTQALPMCMYASIHMQHTRGAAVYARHPVVTGQWRAGAPRLRRVASWMACSSLTAALACMSIACCCGCMYIHACMHIYMYIYYITYIHAYT